jgi:hypothetical protein
VDDWTTDNRNNQALASDLEVWYSLDGGTYVKIGDFAFTTTNYVAGFGGSFSAGSASTVRIKVNLKAGTHWGDGDTTSKGPWYSSTVNRANCPTPTPTTEPTPTPTGTEEPTTEPTPTPTPTTAPTPTPTGTEEPTTGPTATPTTAPTATPTTAPTATPTGGVEGATGRPNVTPPPTSTLDSSGDGSTGNLVLMLLTLTEISLVAMLFLPISPLRRRRRR